MTPAAFAALSLLGAQEPTSFPTDADIRLAFEQARPGARILQQSRIGSSVSGNLKACGIAEIGGVPEPFIVVARWRDTSVVLTHFEGRRVTPPPPHWDFDVSAAKGGDYDGNGEINVHDRNGDTLQRQVALTLCPSLRPPEGVTWITEFTRSTDDPVDTEASRLARRMTDLIFGRTNSGTQSGPARSVDVQD